MTVQQQIAATTKNLSLYRPRGFLEAAQGPVTRARKKGRIGFTFITDRVLNKVRCQVSEQRDIGQFRRKCVAKTQLREKRKSCLPLYECLLLFQF